MLGDDLCRTPLVRGFPPLVLRCSSGRGPTASDVEYLVWASWLRQNLYVMAQGAQKARGFCADENLASVS
jgi:hypothetical protein